MLTRASVRTPVHTQAYTKASLDSRRWMCWSRLLAQLGPAAICFVFSFWQVLLSSSFVDADLFTGEPFEDVLCLELVKEFHIADP